MVTVSAPKLNGALTSLNDTVCSTIKSLESVRVSVRVLSTVVGEAHGVDGERDLSCPRQRQEQHQKGGSTKFGHG